MGGKERNGGDTPAYLRCYKCGGLGHHVAECKSTGPKCFKCGK